MPHGDRLTLICFVFLPFLHILRLVAWILSTHGIIRLVLVCMFALTLQIFTAFDSLAGNLAVMEIFNFFCFVFFSAFYTFGTEECSFIVPFNPHFLHCHLPSYKFTNVQSPINTLMPSRAA